MIKIPLLLAFWLNTFTSCTRSAATNSETQPAPRYLKATVLHPKDLSCNKPVLDFSEDSLAVRQLSGMSASIYVVDELSVSLNITGKKLSVLASRLKPEEDFICNMQGITYPHLKLLEAKARD